MSNRTRLNPPVQLLIARYRERGIIGGPTAGARGDQRLGNTAHQIDEGGVGETHHFELSHDVVRRRRLVRYDEQPVPSGFRRSALLELRDRVARRGQAGARLAGVGAPRAGVAAHGHWQLRAVADLRAIAATKVLYAGFRPRAPGQRRDELDAPVVRHPKRDHIRRRIESQVDVRRADVDNSRAEIDRGAETRLIWGCGCGAGTRAVRARGERNGETHDEDPRRHWKPPLMSFP